MSNDLSIVIIGRNEESGLAACISAANIAAEEIGGAEIIYVDSASTDSSVEIAAGMGCRVLSMRPEWKLCPSAGRYIGSRYAKGAFILFLDADTHIYTGFLGPAIDHLRANDKLAGVNGRIDDLDENGDKLDDVEERFDTVAETRWLRGPACLYRRAALNAVDSFNPHLAMEEEAELGLRLLRTGWKLHLIPVPMACHTRCYHCQTLTSVVTTFRRDIATGRLGEITRTIAAAALHRNLLAFCWLRLKTTILLVAWLALMIMSLLVLGGVVTIAILLAGLAAVYVKKRSLSQTFVFIANKLAVVADVLAGIPKVTAPTTGIFPLDVIEQKAK